MRNKVIHDLPRTTQNQEISLATAKIHQDDGDNGEQPSHNASDDESQIAYGRGHRQGRTGESATFPWERGGGGGRGITRGCVRDGFTIVYNQPTNQPTNLIVGLNVVGETVGLKVGLTLTIVAAAIADTVPIPVLACRVLLKIPTASQPMNGKRREVN